MGAINYNDNSIEGDVYIQRLSSYIRRNEEALANGLLCFSKNRNHPKVKPLRLSFTIHHLYYITERIESSPLGVDVGPLNVKLDNPNHEPTFISFMANNARSSKHFDSDTRSISSISSVRSIVSSASVYWRSFGFSKDPKIINKDLKYLYSSFTKIPCLILTPKTKVNSISSYEEYPCDTSVPVKMFKNLQVLEINDYEPNEIFGWHILSEQLRILIVKSSKINSLEEILFNLVIDDESGRSSFNSHKQSKKYNDFLNDGADGSFSNEAHEYPQFSNNAFKYSRRETTSGASSLPKDLLLNLDVISSNNKDYQSLPDSTWSFLKQLTVSETSISSIPSFNFKPLSNLVKLNLSNNLLEELPDGLDQLLNIKYLNFSDNYITNLKKLPNNLKYLSTLNFNNNRLSCLDGLEDLQSLEKIDLRRNILKEIKDLKPIILQFTKNPDKFNNVYVSNNKLPKNYRIDLFNLLNGIKYKNYMKIDDSRPGYFEGAVLLDAESASKYFEKFMNDSAKEDITTKGANDIVSKPEIDSLMGPFAALSFISDNDENKPNPATRKKFDLSHNIATTSLTFQSDTTSAISAHKTQNSPLYKNPGSPLSANNNLSNKPDSPTSYTSKPQIMSLNLTSSSTAPIPNSSNLKRSTTLTQLDLDTSASTNAAPNILTPVQVTARMST